MSVRTGTLGSVVRSEDPAPLTPAEREQLARHEAVIEAARLAGLEAGAALEAIRDRRLYRSSHGTFEAYALDRWDMSRQRAAQLIAAAQVVRTLSTMLDVRDLNERQLRELTSLTPDDQPVVYGVASATAPEGRVTSAYMRQVVDVVRRVSRGAIDDGNGAVTKWEALSRERKADMLRANLVAHSPAGARKPRACELEPLVETVDLRVVDAIYQAITSRALGEDVSLRLIVRYRAGATTDSPGSQLRVSTFGMTVRSLDSWPSVSFSGPIEQVLRCHRRFGGPLIVELAETVEPEPTKGEYAAPVPAAGLSAGGSGKTSERQNCQLDAVAGASGGAPLFDGGGSSEMAAMPKKKRNSDIQEVYASYRETAPRLDLEFFVKHSRVMDHPGLADRVRALHERILHKNGTRNEWRHEYRRITSAYWAATPWACNGGVGAAQATTATHDETHRESQADEERQIPEEGAEATAAPRTVGDDMGTDVTAAARTDGNEERSGSPEGAVAPMVAVSSVTEPATD